MKHDPKLVEAMAREHFKVIYGPHFLYEHEPLGCKRLERRAIRAALDAQAHYIKRKKKEKRHD